MNSGHSGLSGPQQGDTSQDVVQYDPVYRVQICVQHQQAVRNLYRHLREEHTGLSQPQRKAILDLHQRDDCVDPTQFQPPSQPVPALSSLKPPIVVLQCAEASCPRRLVSQVQMAQHCNQQHGWRKSSDRPTFWTMVLAQTFFTGALTKYFPVHDQALEDQSLLILRPRQRPLRASVPRERQESEILATLTPQQRQVAEQSLQDRHWSSLQHEIRMQKADKVIAKQDRTGWYARTGWPQHFAGRNLVHIARTSRLPDRHEVVLVELVRMFNEVWWGAINGLSALSQETRRWLRSPKASDPDVRPLARLQTD